MTVGRSPRRYVFEFACLAACLHACFAAGCNAVQQKTLIPPRVADIRTRTNADPAVENIADLAAETPDQAKLSANPPDEISPLPVALQAPEGTAPAPNPPPPSLSVLPGDPSELPRAEDSRPQPDSQIKLASATFDEIGKVAPAAVPVSPTPPIPPPSSDHPEPPPTAAPVAMPAPVIETPKEPAAPEPKPEPVKKSAEEAWRDGVQALHALARERSQGARDATQPNAPNWQVRERLLAWLAGPEIESDARSPEEYSQGRSILKGFAAVLDAKDPRRADAIREAVNTLEAQIPLEITDLKICRMIHGFGKVEALEPPVRKSGQPVVLYCELAGLAYESAAAGYRSRVSAQVELFPEGSDAPVWTHALGTAEDDCTKRRRDFYVGQRFNLPDSIAPGKYRLKLTEKDLVANRVAHGETVITITK